MLHDLVNDVLPAFTMAHIDAKQLLEAHHRLEVATREPPADVQRVTPSLRRAKGSAPRGESAERGGPADEGAAASGGGVRSTAGVDALREGAHGDAALLPQPLRLLLDEEQLQEVQVRAHAAHAADCCVLLCSSVDTTAQGQRGGLGCVQKHAEHATHRLDNSPPAEGKMARHILRVLKRMNVLAQRESDVLRGRVRVDLRFLKPFNKQRLEVNLPVVMEVDGPSHFLLELPRTPGEQLAPEERDVYTTIRGLIQSKRVDEATSLQDLFQGEEWGASLHLPACSIWGWGWRYSCMG